MAKENYNPFDKKFEEINKKLNKIKLKGLRSTVAPRDSIFAVECLDIHCGEFWQPHKIPTHNKFCKNPFKTQHTSKTILEIITN